MFIPISQEKRILPKGSPKSRIAIIGDYASGFDMRSMIPLTGPAGTVLEQCLHAAGLIRGEIYISLLIKDYPKRKLKGGNEYFTLSGSRVKFSEHGIECVTRLRDEIASTEANVILALGPATFAALCDLGKYNTYRGYIFPSSGSDSRKVIPSIDPMTTIRGSYESRYILVGDLRKAKAESNFRDLVRPDRKLIYSFVSVEEVMMWLEYFSDQPIVSVDIEVINYEVSCISFSSEPSVAISLPIHERWSLPDEVIIWRGIQEVLGNPKSVKVFQNGIFDIHFLLTRNGIIVRGPIHDTMIAHSIMYPELKKGLGFLGSIYCGSQEYWKDTVRFNNIKGES